jgi:hypothetical protein
MAKEKPFKHDLALRTQGELARAKKVQSSLDLRPTAASARMLGLPHRQAKHLGCQRVPAAAAASNTRRTLPLASLATSASL